MLNQDSRGKIIADLYTKEFLSMAQIGKKFGLSVSGVRHHLNRSGVKRRSLPEAISRMYITRFRKLPFQIKNKFSSLDKQLKLAGVMLYWGEGAKTGGTVKFANSDPLMIKVFLRFLREVCGIVENRLKVLIHMYPDHDEKFLKKFWSTTCKIPYSRFYRSFIHAGLKGTYKNKSHYGTLSVNYSDKKLLLQILLWGRKYQTLFLKVPR